VSWWQTMLGVEMGDTIVRRSSSGVRRLVDRLERERRRFMVADEVEIPTARAWRVGVVEGLRLAQLAIRRGV
jgi:hypothetical protein